MNLRALSSRLVSEAITILNADPTFYAKSESEKLGLLSKVTQELCTLSKDAGFNHYHHTNFADPLTPYSGGTGEASVAIRVGNGYASIAGTAITYMKDGVASPLSKIPEIVLPLGVSYISPEGVDSRTLNGFTAYAVENMTPFSFIAAEGT